MFLIPVVEGYIKEPYSTVPTLFEIKVFLPSLSICILVFIQAPVRPCILTDLHRNKMSNQKFIISGQQAAQSCLNWTVPGSGFVSHGVYIAETGFLDT